jgi:hypothetical protein
MGLKEAFESLLQMGKPSRKIGDTPVSIVLFLREQHFPTLEQLRLAAERAFRRSFSGDKKSQYCVYQQVLFTLARIGPHTLSFLCYTKPYGADDPEFGIVLPLASQRRAWAEHTSWIALDYVKGDAAIDSQYVVLARLCAELCDVNCIGLYLPREKTFVPGEESVRGQLSKIIAHRDVNVT